ncbi:hypothetical protein JCM10207_005669 [Rhodosporidiobolus poonsookiae]
MFSPFISVLAGLASLSMLASTAAAYGAGFTGSKVLSGYYPSYSMQPADVAYSKYTHLDYFVFTTTSDPAAISQAGISDAQIVDFVTRAHAAGVTTSYTVGGWTGSAYFSTHVATAESRAIFARALVAVMQQYNFDGIDIDWEYPGSEGQAGNVVSPNDAANFLLFLQTLRNLAGVDARLSIAVSVAGIRGADGNVLTDMSGFAAVLDYITLMTYDITGTWSGFTGPNAPLYSTCAPASNQLSIDSAVRLYTAAGFVANHIIIGIPYYSYAYYVTTLTQKTCPDGTTTTMYQYATSGTTCGTYIGNAGQYTYKQLVENGWFVSQSRFRRLYDKLSQTWVLFNNVNNLFIPTETPTTAVVKGRYAFQRRLAGVTVFDVSGDTTDSALTNGLRTGLRLDYGAQAAAKRMAKRHLDQRRSAARSLIH